MNIQAKELIDLLEEKDMWNYGDAKPCSILINQGNRFGVVTMGNLDDYNVAYKMPNGRLYAKKVTKKEAFRILETYYNYGFRWIDTATNYPIDGNPENQQQIGAELQSVFRDYGWQIETTAKRLVATHKLHGL